MNNTNLEVLKSFTRPAAHGVDRIVSDGQSGAARGALDAAIELGISHGGNCATERVADDGLLDKRYEVHACKGGFGERCARNIRGSDGTLLLSFEASADIDGRTRYARDHAAKKRKASAHLQLHRVGRPNDKTVAGVRTWIARTHIRVLHVTGPLETKEPGISQAVKNLLVAVLDPEDCEATS